jgi:hypothetical protein
MIDFGHRSRENEQTYTLSSRRLTACDHSSAARVAPLPLEIQTNKSHPPRRVDEVRVRSTFAASIAEPVALKDVHMGNCRFLSRHNDARRRPCDCKSHRGMELTAVPFCRQKRVHDNKRQIVSL